MKVPKNRGPAMLQGRQLRPNSDIFTVPILGVPRGGTTMVAGAVRRCGLSLGKDLPGNLEDPDFVSEDMARMKAAVASRNATLSAWGWKYPRAGNYLPKLIPELRNPRVIIVWRDLMAVTSRKISRGDSTVNAFQTALRIQARNIRLMKNLACPILHVSYEKAIINPESFVQILADFVGGRPPEDMDELRSFMKPGSYKPVEDEDAD